MSNGIVYLLRTIKAFVIHATHDIFCVYYCRFSRAYLRDVAKYGSKFKKESSKSVRLYRTKRFHMSNTGERVEFFRFLAKLLWFLTSGKAHAGYLLDYEKNPLHTLVSPFDIFFH